MLAPSLPPDEAQRLLALHRLRVLDTPPEPAFDDIAEVVRHVLAVPIALISLVDCDRQWFKARCGLEAESTGRDMSFCGHAIFERAPLVVPDATADPRFQDNPLVTGPLALRWYVGAPLITADGFVLGTLCAIDHVPRPAPSAEQMGVLVRLADAVVRELESRRMAMAQGERARLAETSDQLTQIANRSDSLHQALEPVLADLCRFTGASLGRVWLRSRADDDLFLPSDVVYREPGQTQQWPLQPPSPFALVELTAWPTTVLHGLGVRCRSDLASCTDAAGMAAHRAGLTNAWAIVLRDDRASFGLIEAYGRLAPPDEEDLMTLCRHVGEQLGRLVARERLERMKDDFVNTVSHELRTPMTAINGTLELLVDQRAGALPPKAMRMLEIAQRNGMRLTRMVNDILDIGKIESGQLSLNPQPQGLAVLIERAVHETAPFAQAMGVSIDWTAPGFDVQARVDGDRFIQVMTNLLSNAAKFSPANKPVRVSMTGTDETVRVAVADDGPGIPEEFRPRVFDRFAQFGGAGSRRSAGTGLGLAIVRHLVIGMGGQVGFKSECGRGTVFHVEFPRWLAGADGGHRAGPEPANAPSSRASYGSSAPG